MNMFQSFDDDDSEPDIIESHPGPPSPHTDSEAEMLALLDGKLVDNCLVIAIHLFSPDDSCNSYPVIHGCEERHINNLRVSVQGSVLPCKRDVSPSRSDHGTGEQWPW